MKKLLVLSGKGGTGKTTAAGAMIRFARAGASADCDVDAPNLHLVAGVGGQPERKRFIGSEKARINPAVCVGCGRCAELCRFQAIGEDQGAFQVREHACEGCGVCAWACPVQAVTMEEDKAGEQYLYREARVFSTARLKMGRGNTGKLVTAVKLDMMKGAPEADFAVIDGSPGIGCPVMASISGVDLVLIVAEPSLSGRSDLERLLDTVEGMRARAAVCVNKWDVSPENTAGIMDLCRMRNIPFLGKIPYDRSASDAVNKGITLAEIDCPARDALYHIYEQVSQLLALPSANLE